MQSWRAPLITVCGLVSISMNLQAQQSASGAVVTRSMPASSVANDTVLNIPSYAFQGASPYSDQILDDGNTYRYFSTSGGSQVMIAPVVGLPTGVVIDMISVASCSAADFDLAFGLYAADNGGGGPGTLLFPAYSLMGCEEAYTTSAPYEYTAAAGAPLYIKLPWSTHYDGSDKFNDVAIYYHRVVTPAPATSDFTDVPTSSPQFQFIEALFKAGITAGCGGGNYCPDQAVTRGQMAVFLSKALGLWWPN